MRAEQERPRTRFACLVAADEIADVVAAHGHAGGAHPAGHRIVHLGHWWGAVAAGEPVRLLAVPGQDVAALQDGAGGCLDALNTVGAHGSLPIFPEVLTPPPPLPAGRGGARLAAAIGAIGPR